MNWTKKLALLLSILMMTAIGGVAFAATYSEPLVKVVPTVRYEPPEEEVGAVVTVNRITPKPKTIGFDVLFDREGTAQNPQLFISVGRPGHETSVDFYYDPDEDTLVTLLGGESAVMVFDKTCNLTGVC